MNGNGPSAAGSIQPSRTGTCAMSVAQAEAESFGVVR
jgi:hypothetical protein